MKTIAFTEFRRRASRLLSAVEEGETIVVLRHGKPIAEIKPVVQGDDAPAWKKPGLRLAVKGATLSSTIAEEREREGVL